MASVMISARASAGQRLVAFLLDYLVICCYIVLLTMCSLALLNSPVGASLAPIFATAMRRDIVAFVTLILPVILYFTIGEASARRGSWGKRVRGLSVTDRQGGRLSFGRALLRSMLKFLPWQIAHTSLFHIPGWPLEMTTMPLGSQVGLAITWLLVGVYLFGMLRSTHQTVYDWLAGTVVVKNA